MFHTLGYRRYEFKVFFTSLNEEELLSFCISDGYSSINLEERILACWRPFSNYYIDISYSS